MPAPQANQSAAFVFNMGEEPVFFVWGGYTKLEDAAVKIAADLATAGYANNANTVQRSVELAEQVLAECRSRQGGVAEAQPVDENEHSPLIQ